MTDLSPHVSFVNFVTNMRYVLDILSKSEKIGGVYSPAKKIGGKSV